MPRSLSRLTLSTPLLAVLLAGPVLAQQQSTAQPTQNRQPPANVQSVEPGSDSPATNIPTRRGTQVDEHRDNGGQVTGVGSHDSMQPNNLPGNAAPGSVTGNQVRGATWTVGTFDLSGKRHGNSGSGTNAPAADVPPPPPPLPSSTSNQQ
jgi:hypothetical protein